MISLVFKFYIPAFFITLILAAAISGLSILFFFSSKKSKEPGRGQRFFHELFILNLLTIPVVSVAVLAIVVVIESMKI